MILYGRDNSGQPFGGGIICASRYIIGKPCYLSVIDDSSTVIAVLYIFFNNSLVRYYMQSGNTLLRVIIYGR